MRKILLSVLTVGLVGVAAFAGTKAFFTDTETSVDNLLQAGSIDLKVDNTSYYNGWSEDGSMEYSPDTSWEASDLTNQVFFNFTDLKPGDIGEDTISLHLSSNPAWVCADVDLTANDDTTCNDPESDDDPTCAEPNQDAWDGDLAQGLNFIFWNDDGDNVLEDDETVLTSGPADNVLGGVTWALADSNTGGVPMEPGVSYIGKAWCFGNLSQNAVEQDDEGFLGAEDANGPDVRGAGVSCDGAPVNNAAQTDVLRGNISFRAVQFRHNAEYVCTRPEATPAPSPSPSPSPSPTLPQ